MTNEMGLHDPYEDQLSAARFKAERDVARQELDRMRPAFEWVEEHGGLEKIKRQRINSYPRDAYERKRGKLLKHIAECEKALGKRKKRVEELEAEAKGMRERIETMLPRLMPEGMEWLLDVWPKWSNGEYCKFGDWWKSDKYGKFEPQQLSKLSIYTPEQLREWGQDDGDNYGYEWDFMRPSDPKYRPDKVEPPAPKVLDADGVEIRVGDTVYHVKDGSEMTVCGIEGEWLVVSVGGRVRHDIVTRRAPVLAADGEPLEVGQTVWDANGDELVVGALEDGGHTVTCRYADVGDSIPTHGMWSPSDLTHQRPALDADGVPIHDGDKVWIVENGHGPRIVKEMHGPSCVHLLGISASYRADQLTHTKPRPHDSRQAIVNEIGDEMAARIDLLVSSGRWSDAD